MTRIVGSKRPEEVITTTSWRDGQANVKRILNAKKAKTSDKQAGKTDKTQTKSDRATVRTGKGKHRCRYCAVPQAQLALNFWGGGTAEKFSRGDVFVLVFGRSPGKICKNTF
jgi:hypothetical protein